MKRAAGLAILIHACAAGAAFAQTDDELRVLCKDEKALEAIRKQVADYDRERLDWEIEFGCPRLDLPSSPVHDTPEPTPDKSHTDWVYDAVIPGPRLLAFINCRWGDCRRQTRTRTGIGPSWATER